MKQYSSRALGLVAALVTSAVGLASCVGHGHPHVAFASGELVEPSEGGEAPGGEAPRIHDGRVVIVTLDGVRAEDVFNGADPGLRPGVKVDHLMRAEDVMPRTWALVAARGVALGADRPGCGAVHTASGANVSLPGYLEIFSGRKTRCADNACAWTDRDTVLDEAAAAGFTVASIGSWEVLDHAVSRGGVGVFVSEGRQRWPAPRPLAGNLERLVTAGEHAEAFPGSGRYRPDVYTAAIALEVLRTSAPEVLHVGLGDADEWGHRDDYASYLRAIRDADAFLGDLADTLATMGEAGAHTTVLVTTDHGRNSDFRHHGASSPSAARTFLFAFGDRVQPQKSVCLAHDVTLADIAPTVRALLGLAADPARGAGQSITEIAPAPKGYFAAASGGAASGGAGPAGGSAGSAAQRP